MGLGVLVAVAVVVLVTASGALAKSPSGTGISASATVAGHLTRTSVWTIGKSPDLASQMVAVGSSATVHWTITTTKSASGTLGAYLDGQVCVTNAGSVATQGLAITEQLTKPPSMTLLNTVAVGVSAHPVLAAGESWCYPYKLTVPAAAIVPGATYKATAHVTITNQSANPGVPAGPSASASVALPTTATPVDSSISVTDTNGQTFTFSSGGSQAYDQTVACTSADGAHTITDTNTATIQSTGQQASGTATVHCGAPITITTALSQTSVSKGGSVSDQATISGAQTGAGGTITYKVYDNSACTGTPVTDATPTANTITDTNSVPGSKTITFDTAGSYYWQAVYSGDPDHNTLGNKSTCTDEKLTVTSCTPGTIGCPWQNGDLTTYDQSAWGDPSSIAATTLNADFNSVYASTLGVVEVGIPGTAGFSMQFSSSKAVTDYLPSVGTPAALSADLADPITSPSGEFGGAVLGLQLNVDFANAGDLSANSSLKFGDLTVCGLTSDTDLNSKSVGQVLGVENTALGGGTTTDSIADLDAIATDLNNSFSGGTVSAWAQQHLENGSCGWHTGDLTTYGQAEWGSSVGPAQSVLLTGFKTAYQSTGGVVDVGLLSMFYMEFDTGSAVHQYLPQTGSAGVLDTVLLDPTSSSSGSFGGDVTALSLNVAFSDAGLLTANSGLKFGDLTVCGLTSDTDLNGQSVRNVLGLLETALGGGSHTDSIGDLDSVASQFNAAFDSGAPSSFAQNHLVDGSCP